MITNRVDVNNLLAQMREMKSQASGVAQNGLQGINPRSDVEATQALNRLDSLGSVGAATSPNFSTMFSNAISAVNDTQQSSNALATAYEQGSAGVSLTQVMVASQKASVSFSALTQVRNKLVDAYQDIMNMPI